MRTPPRSSVFEFRRPEIAEILGVDQRSITNYVKQGMPQAGRSCFDIREVYTWALRREVERIDRKAPTTDTPRDLLAIAQREKVSLETEIMRKSMLPSDLVAVVVNRIAATVAAQLDALAPRLAGELADVDDPKQIQATLHREARATRRAIAESLRELGVAVAEGKVD